jgi:hypothetical protein
MDPDQQRTAKSAALHPGERRIDLSRLPKKKGALPGRL